MSTVVQAWFGSAFEQLDPRLQQLHRYGGMLRGSVDVRFGKGVGGVLGRRLAKRLNISVGEQSNELEVTIGSDQRGLHWNRRFNRGAEFKSVFVPAGQYPSGYWIEKSSGVELELGVEIVNRGWHWRHRGTCVRGIRIPAAFAPRTIAYKEMDVDAYRFHVDIALPIIGRLLSYSGTLELAPQCAAIRANSIVEVNPGKA
jgi:hypothetical protein